MAPTIRVKRERQKKKNGGASYPSNLIPLPSVTSRSMCTRRQMFALDQAAPIGSPATPTQTCKPHPHLHHTHTPAESHTACEKVR